MALGINVEEGLDLADLDQASAAADPSPTNEAREFGLLRTVPVELGDYNVDHIELTVEDEHNPELLVRRSPTHKAKITDLGRRNWRCSKRKRGSRQRILSPVSKCALPT